MLGSLGCGPVTCWALWLSAADCLMQSQYEVYSAVCWWSAWESSGLLVSLLGGSGVLVIGCGHGALSGWTPQIPTDYLGFLVFFNFYDVS